MDLGASIEAEIAAENYPCLICHNEIGPESPIWSCRACWRVYNVGCIKSWARKSATPQGQWKCPHCSHIYTQKARISWRCWCGKVASPSPEALQAPHSCGQTCGARLSCPHPCTRTCHAGPHEECTAMGPAVKCWCGKQSIRTFCSQTPYGGFGCSNPCERTRKCGHACHRKCHRGKCGPCKVKVKVVCWCGRESKTVPCSKADTARSCNRICGSLLDCGIHHCEKECHSQELHHCSLSPTPGESCPCGKHTAASILGRPRLSCTESIPTCLEICGKLLACGHTCKAKCHNGECPQCATISRVECRCSHRHFDVSCGSPVPKCNTKCRQLLSCGRHRCPTKCCPLARHITNSPALIPEPGTLALHDCTRICSRQLDCGHTCLQPCHPGRCRPCGAASMDDYVCPCGETVVLAPLPCGFKPPKCIVPCRRQRACGHAPLHSCHEDSCPPCHAVDRVNCRCGQTTLLRRCGSTEPRICQEPCKALLECGHPCDILCCTEHAATIAQGAESAVSAAEVVSCDRVCSRELPCGHKCNQKCHPGFECNPCVKPLIARCPCASMLLQYECGEKMEIGCNDECERLGPSHSLIQAYILDKAWTAKIESTIREFVSGNKHTLRFKPMRRSQRRVVHMIAQFCGLDSSSIDPGALRSVEVYRTPDARVPQVTLALAAQATHEAARRRPPLWMLKVTEALPETVTSKDSDGWMQVHSVAPTSAMATRLYKPAIETGSIYDVLN